MESPGTPSIDEILDNIPGNRAAYERLQEILSKGEAIAFIGAGASAPLYPLWGGLIRELADEALRRGRATEDDKARWLGSIKQDPQGVVQDIRTQLGDRIYGEVLRQIFGYKQGEDGNSYTPAHAALMLMPFVGYVTTNYDPGLLEARDKLRPDARATGYVVWTDNDPVYRWYTDAIFQEEKCPVLYAHGVYQRSDTIVLGREGYERAYAPGPYRRLFEKLWGQHQLVFVGFGFSDPWLDYIIHEGIEQLAARAAGEPRHVAVLSLPEDEVYTPQMRRTLVDRFDAEPLFYPVRRLESGDQDHSALLSVLESLAPCPVPVPPSAEPVREVDRAREVFPERWVHETTDDEHYVGREDTMARLDRWTDDEKVRAIGVTGMGGLGKTSLIGHWLKKRGGARRRPVKGLFYWSFYTNRDVTEFLEGLNAFAEEELRRPKPQGAGTLAEQAVCHLHGAPLLVVLDGLEVMQEGPATESYGSLLEEDLR